MRYEEMYMYIGGTGENECTCQQELAAVKADMQGRVDRLQSQLNYWQNVTINILKDLYFSSNSGMIYTLTKRSGYHGHSIYSFKR